MSSSLGAHTGVNTNALNSEIHGSHNLNHIVAPKDAGIRDESNSMGAIKGRIIEEAAHHGTKGLHHVDAPKGDLSDNIKQAYLAEHQLHGGADPRLTKLGKPCASCDGDCKCAK